MAGHIAFKGRYTYQGNIAYASEDYFEVSGILSEDYFATPGAPVNLASLRTTLDAGNPYVIPYYVASRRYGSFIIEEATYSATPKASQINIGLYFDSETNKTYQTSSLPGTTWLGSIDEGLIVNTTGNDYAKDGNGAPPTFSKFTPIPKVINQITSFIKAKYSYENGDYYLVEGYLNSEYGGGSLQAGDKIQHHATHRLIESSNYPSDPLIYSYSLDPGEWEILEATNTPGFQNEIVITGYYDSETDKMLSPYEALVGRTGLASATGYLTSKKGLTDFIGVSSEADYIKKYAKISARLTYSSGDYYDIEASIDDKHRALELFEGKTWFSEQSRSWYTINSIEFVDGELAETDIRITKYYNRYTDSLFTPTSSEFYYHPEYRSTFGTERGSIVSSDGSITLTFNSTSPIAAYPGGYTYAVGKYHYGNGDYFAFSGFISDQHGGGTNGGKIGGMWAPFSQPGSFFIHAEWTDKDAFEEAKNVYGGYYEIEYAYDGFEIAKSYSKQGLRNTALTISSYYSSNQDQLYFPTESLVGTQGLGSEKAIISFANGNTRSVGYNEILDESYAPLYSIAPSSNEIAEGAELSVDIKFENIPIGTKFKYEVVGLGLDQSDLSGGILSELFTYTGQDIALKFNLLEDKKTEGDEKLQLILSSSVSNPQRGGETRHSRVATSSYITVLDTSPDPSYTLNSEKSEYSESENAIFTVVTERVDPGTSLFWRLDGQGISSADFKDSTVAGVASVGSDQRVQIELLLNADKTTEGEEQLTISLFTDADHRNLVASRTVSILDTSKTPSYSITSAATSVDEGDSVDFSFNIENVEDSTQFYWKVISEKSSTLDFVEPVTGSFLLDNNISNGIALTASDDFFTEGEESFQVSLFADSQFIQHLATSADISINDTSKTPTYTVSPSSGLVNEGDIISYQIQTTNLPNEHQLFWRVVGENIDATDIDGANLSGRSQLDHEGSATIQLRIAEDSKSEGQEKIHLDLYSDAAMTNQVAESIASTVKDTSLSDNPEFFLTNIDVDDDINLFEANGLGRLTDTYVNSAGDTYKLFLLGLNSIVHGYRKYGGGLVTIAKYSSNSELLWSKAFQYKPDDRTSSNRYSDRAAKFIEEVDGSIYLSLFDSGYIFEYEGSWNPRWGYARDYTVALNASDGSHQRTASNGYPQRIVSGTKSEEASSARTSNSFNLKDSVILNAGLIGTDSWITGYKTNINAYSGYLVAHSVSTTSSGPSISWQNYIYTPQPVHQLTEDNVNGGTWGVATIDREYAVTKWDKQLNPLVEVILQPETRVEPTTGNEYLNKIVLVKALPSGLLAINGHQPLLIEDTGNIIYYERLPANFGINRVLYYGNRVALLGTEASSDDVYFTELNDVTSHRAFNDLNYIKVNQDKSFRITPGSQENEWSTNSASWDGSSITLYHQGSSYRFDLRDESFEGLRIGERDHWYVSDQLRLNHNEDIKNDTDFTLAKIEDNGLGGFVAAYSLKHYTQSGADPQLSSLNSSFISQDQQGGTLWKLDLKHNQSLASTYQPNFSKTDEGGILFSVLFNKDVVAEDLQFSNAESTSFDLLIGEVSQQGQLSWAQQLSSTLSSTTSASTLDLIGFHDLEGDSRVAVVKHRSTLSYGQRDLFESTVQTPIDDSFHNIALIKLDKTGGLLDSASIQTTYDASTVRSFEINGAIYIYSDIPRQSTIKYDGRLIQSGSNSGDYRRRYIVSVDDALGYQWHKPLPEGDYYFDDFAGLANGDFVAVGSLKGQIIFDGQSVQSTSANGYDVLIAKFTPEGKIYDARAYGTHFDETGYQIEPDGQGGFVVQGRGAYNWENSNEHWRADNSTILSPQQNNTFLARLDANGELQWTRSGFLQNYYNVPFFVRLDGSIVYHDNSYASRLEGGTLKVISKDVELGFKFSSPNSLELAEGADLKLDIKVVSAETIDHLSLYWEITDHLGELASDFDQVNGYVYSSEKSVYGTDKLLSIESRHQWSPLLKGDDSQYVFNVYESANKRQLLTSTAITVIEDQPPTAIEFSNLSFEENIPSNSVVSRLSVIDEDPDQAHTISLVSGEGDSHNALFRLDGNSLILLHSPDYETQPTYSIRLRATDNLGLFVEQVKELQVVDIPDPVRIEGAGDIELWKDALGYIYVRERESGVATYPVAGSIRYKAFAYGSTPVHAEAIDGSNTIITVNHRTLADPGLPGWHLNEYVFDADWNFVEVEGHNSALRGGSQVKDFYRLEADFGADFDGDGEIGHVDTRPSGELIIVGDPSVGQTLSVRDSLVDPDGEPAGAYQWFVDGIYVFTGESYDVDVADEGKALHVVLSYDDVYGVRTEIPSNQVAIAYVDDGSATLGEITFLQDSLEDGVVVMMAPPMQGDPDGEASDPLFSYQWFKDGSPVVGGNSASYQLSADESGLFSVEVSYTDAQFFRRTLRSAERMAADITFPLVPDGTHFSVETDQPGTVLLKTQGAPDYLNVTSTALVDVRASSADVFPSDVYAKNLGSLLSPGTGQRISLDGLGRYAFVAEASADSRLSIHLEKGKNSALFLDDVYGLLHHDIEPSQHSSGSRSVPRLVGVDEIIMGGSDGMSIVDLTSRDYVIGPVTVQGAGSGLSVFWGSADNDFFLSGGGDSLVFTGAGKNAVTLGAGTDVLQYRLGGNSADTIANFDVGADSIELWSGLKPRDSPPVFSQLDSGSILMQWGGNTVEFLAVAGVGPDSIRYMSSFPFAAPRV